MNEKKFLIDYSNEFKKMSVDAYFTTRKGGISTKGYATLNMGTQTGDAVKHIEENIKRVFEVIPKKKRHIVCNQIHSAIIFEDDGIKTGCLGNGDGIISHYDDVIIQTYHADCLPIYAAVEDAEWFGLVHSGWKGTYAEIGVKLVNKLAQKSGKTKDKIKVVIGAGIDIDSYEVGEDLYQKFSQKFGSDCVKRIDSAYHLSLKQAVQISLIKNGLSKDNIIIEQASTFNDEERFYSYRRQGAHCGRMAALMMKTK